MRTWQLRGIPWLHFAICVASVTQNQVTDVLAEDSAPGPPERRGHSVRGNNGPVRTCRHPLGTGVHDNCVVTSLVSLCYQRGLRYTNQVTDVLTDDSPPGLRFP